MNPRCIALFGLRVMVLVVAMTLAVLIAVPFWIWAAQFVFEFWGL